MYPFNAAFTISTLAVVAKAAPLPTTKTDITARIPDVPSAN